MITAVACAVGGLVALTPAAGLGPVATAAAAPTVNVSTMISGLRNPWDVLALPEGLLTAERGGRFVFRSNSGTTSTVEVVGGSGLWVAGETGRMGLAADPDYRSASKRLYSCEGYDINGVQGVRIMQWQLSISTRPVRLTYERTVKSRIPASSGRHGGCRLAFAADKSLLVTTGDGAVGTNPQDLNSLAGKVLRMNRAGGTRTDNPYYSRGGNARYVYAYGHRNIQGIDIRPGTSEIWTAEHGPDRDDEVNRIRRGGNSGWNPVPGYNEGVPMTDTSLPNTYAAAWRSGSSTVATSGLAFLQGSGWGSWQGAIAVAELKGQGIRILKINAAGQVTSDTQVAAVDNRYGRIRSITAVNNALYVTTDNGSGDRVLRLTPA